MNTPYQRFQMLATICVSFVQAACGCSTSAVVFWITLFWAAALSGQVERPRRRSPAGLM